MKNNNLVNLRTEISLVISKQRRKLVRKEVRKTTYHSTHSDDCLWYVGTQENNIPK